MQDGPGSDFELKIPRGQPHVGSTPTSGTRLSYSSASLSFLRTKTRLVSMMRKISRLLAILFFSSSIATAGDWFEGSVGGQAGIGIPELKQENEYESSLVYGFSFRVPAMVTRHALELALNRGRFESRDSSTESEALKTMVALNVLIGHFNNLEQQEKKKQRTGYAILGIGFQASGDRSPTFQVGGGFQKRHLVMDLQYVGFPSSSDFKGVILGTVGWHYVWGM